ncbi:MAG: hypothetical protein ACYCXW_10175 [Solirubrobacteraceae bacterium]
MRLAPYCYAQAFIEPDQTDRADDGEPRQLVTVLICDDSPQDPDYAVCVLTAEQARSLGFELLVGAEHADQLTPGREDQR